MSKSVLRSLIYLESEADRSGLNEIAGLLRSCREQAEKIVATIDSRDAETDTNVVYLTTFKEGTDDARKF